MEQKENIHNLYQACASEIADIHYNALLAIRKEVETLGINTPDQDYNFLLWTLLPMNIEAQSWNSLPLDPFNAIWIDSRDTLDRLQALMPDLSSTYSPSISKLYHGLLNQMMLNQPKHLKPQIAYRIKQDSCGGLLTAYILKHLIDNGKLQPPLPHQSKTITTWMGPVN